MNKEEVQNRLLQNGKPLDLDKFNWDEKTNTFSTAESGILVDFGGINGCTFKTSYDCTFDTGFRCTFDTGFRCTFNTSSHCTFKTCDDCTFETGDGCTFNTGSHCTFNTDSHCTFDTGDVCTFETGDNCTFRTGSGCTLKIGFGCIFKTCDGCTFKTGDVALKEPPLFFTGSRYGIGFLRSGWIKSGCIEKPLDWWEENIARCAEEHKYTHEQIEEYKTYVQFLGVWMRRLGIDKEKKGCEE